MRLLQLIGFAACIFLIVSATGCVSNSPTNTTPPTGTLSENISVKQIPSPVIDDQNATILPEDDTTIIANASIANDISE